MFDIESHEVDKDVQYYQSCLEALTDYSNGTKVFCLIHKMDLIQEDERDQVFKDREAYLRKLSPDREIVCFRTSIWDETLYKAWSAIVYSLIPNVQDLEYHLQDFADIMDADEVLLFERATFLVICHCERKKHKDLHVSI